MLKKSWIECNWMRASNDIDDYEKRIRIKEIPHCAVKFQAGEENNVPLFLLAHSVFRLKKIHKTFSTFHQELNVF